MIKLSDKFGYYSVGEFQTYSKIEAIELHNKTNLHPVWHFNDVAFANYDWRLEPFKDLKELYADRAKQIREKYDYIVIFYS